MGKGRRSALAATIARASRLALQRCLQHHVISLLPDTQGDKPKRQRFKRYPMVLFHANIAEVQTAEGKALLILSKSSICT
jgi:hypothetical protein